MVSRKQGETLPRRVAADTKSGGSSNHNNGNGVLSVGSVGSSIQKAVFDKDFPSLGAEEKQGIAEIGRVASPGLGATASQSLPVGSSALIGGEGWTSALAEVPSVLGSSSTGSLSAQQTVAATSGSLSSSTAAGLNMAEALAQAPSRARSTPQVVKLVACVTSVLIHLHLIRLITMILNVHYQLIMPESTVGIC